MFLGLFVLLFLVAIIGNFGLPDADLITLLHHIFRRHRQPKNGFLNQTIWVVGASSGIGEYLVYNLVRQGAKEIIISARRSDQLDRVRLHCARINEGCKITIVPLDLCEFADPSKPRLAYQFVTEQIFKIVDDIDILVLNGGTTQRSKAMDVESPVFHHLFQVNVMGVIELARAFIRALEVRNRVGKKYPHYIAVTSSLAGRVGAPGQAAYSMSKHAVNGFFEALRMEIVSLNFKIGLICPGPIAVTQHSTSGIGKSMDAGSGRKDSIDTKRGKKMNLERCVELYTTALRYRLTESWISPTLFLTLVYLRQYFPGFVGPLAGFGARLRMSQVVKPNN